MTFEIIFLQIKSGAAAAAGIPAAAGVALPTGVVGVGGIAPLLASAAVAATAVALVAGLGAAIAIFPPNSFPDHQFDAFSVIFREETGKFDELYSY